MKKQKREAGLSVDYHPHHAQSEIHKDPHRFRVAVCGRRFGKTTMAVAELVFSALRKSESMNWYVAPTYRQAKQIAWKMLQKMVPSPLVVRRHEHELSLTLRNGSVLELKGTDNPESLKGVGLDFVVMDEYAMMKPYVWTEVIRPMVMDYGGEAIFIGTPQGYNHFFDIFQAGVAGTETYDKDYSSYRRPTYENPHIDPTEIEKAKAEMTKSAFAQEILADFRAHVGKVYPEFDRTIHVVPPFEIPAHFSFGRYMDRGWRVPTGVGVVAISDTDDIYIIDEIYETALTNPHLAEMIKQRSANRYFWHSYADSAQASDLADLSTLGAHFEPVKKQPGEMRGEWVKAGITKVAERLKVQEGSGKPKLFVFSSCKKHIFEFEHYEWDDKKEADTPIERPKKKYDHLMDGLRYFLMEYKAEIPYEQSSQTKRDWSFR